MKNRKRCFRSTATSVAWYGRRYWKVNFFSVYCFFHLFLICINPATAGWFHGASI